MTNFLEKSKKPYQKFGKTAYFETALFSTRLDDIGENEEVPPAPPPGYSRIRNTKKGQLDLVKSENCYLYQDVNHIRLQEMGEIMGRDKGPGKGGGRKKVNAKVLRE